MVKHFQFSILCFQLILLLVSQFAIAENHLLTSPDGHIRVTVSADDSLSWQVCYDSIVAIDRSPIRIMVRYPESDSVISYGRSCEHLRKGQYVSVDRTIPQPTYVKRSSVRDNYHVLTFRWEKMAIEFRAYNDGAAYRFIPLDNNIEVLDETVSFRFAGDYPALIPYENDLRGGQTMCFSFESYYDSQSLSQMYPDSLCITPLCVTIPGNLRVIPAETNLRSYPGMFLRKGQDNSLEAAFPRVPLTFEIGGFTDLNLMPTSRASYIAKRTGLDLAADDLNAVLPWRAVGVFSSDAAILNSDFMQCLAQSDFAPDNSRPKNYWTVTRGEYGGQCTWDWWNNWGLTGVSFKPGINNQTYEYYARFAAQHHIPYMIVDDGWSDHGDLRKTVGDLNVPQLIRYADSLHVGVVLWSSYRALKDNTEEVMDYYAQMGVRGFKVDFFDRNDQIITDDVWRLARLAAERHLIIDLHGYMPIGIQAVYPNVVSFEGVKGLENFKWEKMLGTRTEHDHPLNVVQVPFLRGFIGPYDFTPGSMRNADYELYAKGGLHTIGTRCNQLAMYIVQEAPFQMLADSPTEYEANPEATDFITSVPTIFDETIVLDARLGEYIVIARRAGKTWYLAATTDQPRTLSVPLSFLSAGKHIAQVAEDDLNDTTGTLPAHHYSATFRRSDTLTLRLAYAGGWAAVIR